MVRRENASHVHCFPGLLYFRNHLPRQGRGTLNELDGVIHANGGRVGEKHSGSSSVAPDLVDPEQPPQEETLAYNILGQSKFPLSWGPILVARGGIPR